MIPARRIVKAYRKYIGSSQDEWSRHCGARPLSLYVAWELGRVSSPQFDDITMSKIPPVARELRDAPVGMKAILLNLTYGSLIFKRDNIDSIGIQYDQYHRALRNGKFSEYTRERIEKVFARLLAAEGHA